MYSSVINYKSTSAKLGSVKTQIAALCQHPYNHSLCLFSNAQEKKYIHCYVP